MRRTLTLSAVLLPLAAWAGDAPYGLVWGAGIEALPSCEIVHDDGQTAWCVVRNPKSAPVDTAALRLIVDRRFGLQYVDWLSKDIADDANGTNGVAAYRALKNDLSARFGRPHRSAEESLHPERFYPCLSSDGCAAYLAKWTDGDAEDVYLRLTANKNATAGVLEVVYEGPRWDDIKEAKKVK